MRRTKLGSQGLEVSAQGLGCMGMTWAYGGGDEQSGVDTIHRALALGVTFLDTAEVYGPYTNERLIRRAHATHPLTAVQSEYSLWTRDPEDEVLSTLRELGIGLVAYSPLGRGFLTGQIRSIDDLPEDDWRRTNPRFQEEALRANLELADRVRELAEERGVTPAQLALAWVLAKGDDIVPIPGTKQVARIEENAGASEIELSEEDLSALEDVVSSADVVGSRYRDSEM